MFFRFFFVPLHREININNIEYEKASFIISVCTAYGSVCFR